MQTFEYSCNHCAHFIKTSGPWPYYKQKAKKVQYKNWMEASSGPIHGLMAEVYCPSCDKIKVYSIVEYERPLTSLNGVWLSDIPRRLKDACHRCKSPVFLTFPPGTVKCPRCKKGKFEIYEPFEEDSNRSPVPPPAGVLKVRQGGKTIQIPKPTVVIDSQEHMGYRFERFSNWFAGTVRRRLPIGDYTLLGMEDEIIVERKTLPDLVKSVIQEREGFIQKCKKLSAFKKKCLVIEGSLGLLKTPYEDSQAHPNAVLGSLIAAQERWDIPVYFLDNFLLAEEFVASLLSKYHAYRWLETNGFKRCLIEGDI